MEEKDGYKPESKQEEKKSVAIEKKKLKLQKKREISENSNLLVDKKNINAAIKKQIEFYFSDSNLYHDNYLYKLLEESGKKLEVNSDLILKFERIKQIFDESFDKAKQLELIKSALADSSIVTLSEDMKNFRRKKRFNKEEYKKLTQIDKRTIYIENFPTSIDHETLASIFAKIGKILHISLPRFPQSKKPKGFAFIEFESIEKSKEAIEKLNGVIPAEFIDPENSHYVISEGIIINT